VMQLEQQGTIAYMAPEVLLGAQPGRQSDIYAMGVILFELATGARPFGTMSGLALAAAQMQSSSADWTFPDTLPEEVVKLIRAMTARRLDQRLASMHLVGHRAGSCAELLTQDASISGSEGSPPRRRRAEQSRTNQAFGLIRTRPGLSAAVTTVVFSLSLGMVRDMGYISIEHPCACIF
jgi:eukaryotic-like serine/threonine-protein kinase